MIGDAEEMKGKVEWDRDLTSERLTRRRGDAENRYPVAILFIK